MKPLILAILCVVGCADIDAKLEQRYVAPELLDGTVLALADTFFAHCGGREKVPFIVLVSRLPEGAGEKSVGRCTLIPGGAVYILRDAWLSYSDKRRMIILAHELGHCALGLTHNPNNWLMSGALIPEGVAVEKSEADIWSALGCK